MSSPKTTDIQGKGAFTYGFTDNQGNLYRIQANTYKQASKIYSTLNIPKHSPSATIIGILTLPLKGVKKLITYRRKKSSNIKL